MNRWYCIASMKLEMFGVCTIVATVLLSVNGNQIRPPNNSGRIENSTWATVNRVGGFEEVYRWKQITFTPLRPGLLAISAFFFQISETKFHKQTQTIYF